MRELEFQFLSMFYVLCSIFYTYIIRVNSWRISFDLGSKMCASCKKWLENARGCALPVRKWHKNVRRCARMHGEKYLKMPQPLFFLLKKKNFKTKPFLKNLMMQKMQIFKYAAHYLLIWEGFSDPYFPRKYGPIFF